MKKYLLFIVYLMFLSKLVTAEVFTVIPANSGRQTSIQAAVDAALGGDIIELEDGTFTGNGNEKITINKDITICSKSGNSKNCIIDVNGGQNEFKPGFLITGGNVRIKNITIKRGVAADA